MIQEFYSKLSDSEKKVFYFAIAAVILALFDTLFLRPVFSRLEVIDQEVSEKKNSLKQDLRFLYYKDKILKEQEAFKVFKTDERKTEEEIIAGFLKTVELLASESNINLVKLNPAGSTPKKGFILYNAVLECEGRLNDMVQFMHRIDSTDNLLKVVRLEMSGKKASAENVKVSMRVAKLIIDPKTIGNYDFSEEDQQTLPSDMIAASGKSGRVPSSETGMVAPRGGGPSGGASNEDNDFMLGGDRKDEPAGDTAMPAGADGGDNGFSRISGDRGGDAGDGRRSTEPAGPKTPAPEEKPKKETEIQKKFSEVGKGGRVRVKNIETLWEEFWTKAFSWAKPKEPQVQGQPVDPGNVPDDYYDESNLWEKKLHKP